ncbi:MAG: cob(I)yrinic acid a,c-diamide adenosyltransferase [bacterium]|nr:cob(I)yrinic acid a,c-diamide adenosyltransferase [bacterium]
MFIIFTGNGKGKTTAAIGQAMRAVGNGSSVLMVEMVKGPWKSGEDASSKKMSKSFQIVKKGLGFVRIGNDKIPFEKHAVAAREALTYSLNELKTDKWNILILDEIWVALSLELLTSPEVRDFIKSATPLCDHLIMTGRGCPTEFIDRADLVTEMKEIKHPFNSGIMGRVGVEF